MTDKTLVYYFGGRYSGAIVGASNRASALRKYHVMDGYKRLQSVALVFTFDSTGRKVIIRGKKRA